MANISSALIADLDNSKSLFDELEIINIDNLPDPEGYRPGQEDEEYDPNSDRDDYDDGYEPDFAYDAF